MFVSSSVRLLCFYIFESTNDNSKLKRLSNRISSNRFEKYASIYLLGVLSFIDSSSFFSDLCFPHFVPLNYF